MYFVIFQNRQKPLNIAFQSRFKIHPLIRSRRIRMIQNMKPVFKIYCQNIHVRFLQRSNLQNEKSPRNSGRFSGKSITNEITRGVRSQHLNLFTFPEVEYHFVIFTNFFFSPVTCTNTSLSELLILIKPNPLVSLKNLQFFFHFNWLCCILNNERQR